MVTSRICGQPLAIEATSISSKPAPLFDKETTDLLLKGINHWYSQLKISVSSEIQTIVTPPEVIISASGMCEQGAPRQKHNLWRPESLILLWDIRRGYSGPHHTTAQKR